MLKNPVTHGESRIWVIYQAFRLGMGTLDWQWVGLPLGSGGTAVAARVGRSQCGLGMWSTS